MLICFWMNCKWLTWSGKTSGWQGQWIKVLTTTTTTTLTQSGWEILKVIIDIQMTSYKYNDTEVNNKTGCVQFTSHFITVFLIVTNKFVYIFERPSGSTILQGDPMFRTAHLWILRKNICGFAFGELNQKVYLHEHFVQRAKQDRLHL